MTSPDPLTRVIQEALAAHGIDTYRPAAKATGIGKDALRARYEGERAWTYPDICKVAAFLGISTSELVARAEGRAA